jgi:hypothetical protein
LHFARTIKNNDRGWFVDNTGFSHFPGVDAAEQAVEALVPERQTAARGEAAGKAVPPWSVLPPAVRAAFEAELRPGERVQWLGLPMALTGWRWMGETLAVAASAVIALSLFFGFPVLAFFFGRTALGVYGGILAAVLTARYVWWAATSMWKSRELGSVYVVTNLRAMRITATGEGREVWSALPGEIAVRKMDVRKDGSGDILFFHEFARHPEKDIAREKEAGFERVADVATAKAALERLA